VSDTPNTPRPFEATEWEEDNRDEHRAAGAKASNDMQDLIEATKAMADSSAAVERLTKESIVADNKKFRRRNGVLVSLIIVLCIGIGYLIYRDVAINAPGRDKIAAQTVGLQDANAKLDDINEFINEIRSDGEEPTDPQLQEVFNTVFEIEATLDCVLTAPDDASIAACAGPE
jgi:hypothetical protein